MPVEFLCPHCRARMRTEDDAMGRQIGCPKCKGRLTIPTIDVPDPEPVVMLVDETPAAAPATAEPAPAFAESSEAEPFNFDAAATSPKVAAAAPGSAADIPTGSAASGAVTYRRRKKSSGVGVMVIVALVAAAAVGGFVVLQNSGPGEMKGQLAATVIEGDSVSTSLALPASAAAERLSVELMQDPIALRTQTFDTVFSATESELTVTISKNESGQLVEIDGRSNAAIASFLDTYGANMMQRRQQQLAGNLASMIEAVGTDPVDREAAAGFRDPVGLAAMQASLGPHVVANVDGVAYPVVSEPEPGVLRFAIPAATARFEILRAPANPANVPETFQYTVTVGQ